MAAAAGPAIVRAESLMKVPARKKIIVPPWPVFYGNVDGVRLWNDEVLNPTASVEAQFSGAGAPPFQIGQYVSVNGEQYMITSIDVTTRHISERHVLDVSKGIFHAQMYWCARGVRPVKTEELLSFRKSHYHWPT